MTSQILSTVPPESEEGMTLSGGGQDLRPQTSHPTGQTDPRELFSRGRQELETREGMWGPGGPGTGVSAHCRRTDCRLDHPRAPRDSAPSRLPTWLPHAPNTLNCGAMGSSHSEHPDACSSPMGRGLPSSGGVGQALVSAPRCHCPAQAWPGGRRVLSLRLQTWAGGALESLGQG